MLGMALFKSLVKQHGVQFFQPIGEVLHRADIRRPNLLNPLHAWKLRGPMARYARWLLGRKLSRPRRPRLPLMPEPLREHARWASDWLQRVAGSISATMRKHQLQLADRQCRMAAISQSVQDAVVMLCTSLYAGRQNDELVVAAADVLCQDLHRKLTGEGPSDRYFRDITRLGEAVVDGQFRSIAELPPGEILMHYANE